MKNKTIMLYAFITMLCFCFAQCKKTNTPDPSEQLPPETHTGAYTFGCKVDGKIYTAKGKDGLLASQYVDFGASSDSTINILIGNSVQKFNFGITIKYLGISNIAVTNQYPYTGYFKDNSSGTVQGTSNYYSTDSLNVGRVNIKYFIGSSSPMNGVAGTFEMDAKNANGKIIRITEGRFDIGL